MADFKSRLLLDSSNYEKGLAKAKKSMEGFAKNNEQFGNVVQAVGGKLGQFAGAFGVAMTAGEAFNKMMESSQTFGDTMTVAINGAKDSVNEFFYALGTGDFTSFLDGIDKIVSKSAAASRALDQLGNTKISYSLVRAENNRDLAMAKTKANDKTLDDASRQAGFNQWNAALKDLFNYSKNLEHDTNDAVKKMAEKNTDLNGVTIEAVKKMARLDIQDPAQRDAAKAKYGTQYEEFLAKKRKLVEDRNADYDYIRGHNAPGWDRTTKEVERGAQYQRDLNALTKEYGESILFNNMLNKKNDEELQHIVGLLIEAQNATEELGSKQEEYNNALREFHAQQNGGGGGGGEKVAPAGSLAAIDAQIKAASDLYATVTGDAARQAALKTINELKAHKHELEFIASHPTGPAAVQQTRSSVAGLAHVPELPKIDTGNTGIKSEISDAKDLKTEVNELSGAFGVLGSSIGTQAGAAMSYFANVLQGVVQVTAAISALLPVKEADSQLNAKQAITGAAASQSSIPFVGPMMALAAVASLIAAFTAIPNFADGGIVPGHNFRDGIRANVSSGEMVINQHDQSRLFRAIKSGNFGTGGGETIVKGEQLVLAINNYGQRNGRGRLQFR